jgi:hypothetical protein
MLVGWYRAAPALHAAESQVCEFLWQFLAFSLAPE